MYLRQQNYALAGRLSASIIHDILTPITSLALISGNNLKQSEEAIQTSTKEIKEFVEIMKDFLTESHGNTLLNEEVRKCIKLMSKKALMENVQIQFIEFDQVNTEISSLHIYQIVINLLSNAIDACKNSMSKKIILLLKREESSIRLECRDFGEGIASERIESICEPLYTTKSDGHGLGLYSVKHVVENCLKGTLKIESEPGNGSLFICTIPL